MSQPDAASLACNMIISLFQVTANLQLNRRSYVVADSEKDSVRSYDLSQTNPTRDPVSSLDP